LISATGIDCVTLLDYMRLRENYVSYGCHPVASLKRFSHCLEEWLSCGRRRCLPAWCPLCLHNRFKAFWPSL